MATAMENLEYQLGGDNAKAVDALIDEKLQLRSEDLEELRREVATLREQLGNVDMPEIRKQLNAAAGMLRDAINDHNNLADRRNAGESVSESEVTEGEERIQHVSTDVESVRDSLEGRVTTIEERLDDENTGLAALHNKDVELQEQINEIRSSRSLTTTVTSGSKTGLKAALITFVVIFILVWSWIMMTSEQESWLWAVAWGAIIGGLVGLIVGLVSKEGTSSNAYVQALATTRKERKESSNKAPADGDKEAHARTKVPA